MSSSYQANTFLSNPSIHFKKMKIKSSLQQLLQNNLRSANVYDNSWLEGH